MLTQQATHALRTFLSRGQVFTDRSSLISYEVDAGLDKGQPEGVVFPRTVDEVIQIMRWAAEYHVPLIARGAGTGLSGGAVADQGGVIVEFVHLNTMLDFDSQGRSVVVEPALINLRLDERARAHGLYFPPDPSSQRASTMGGNVAENSGGPHCFKYGVTTNYISGLSAVLPNGQHINVGGRVLDFPEYDLCGLLTGSEGTLALITSITARLLRYPPGFKTLLAVFDTVEQAGEAVSAVIAAGLMPATMEMMDQRIVRIIEPFAHAGLPLDAGAVLIVEVDGYPASLEAQAAELVTILEQHGGYGIRVARDETERYKIWLARKSAAGGIAREAPAYYTVDITVPRSCLGPILADVNEICDRYNLRAGHVLHAGDGNLHPLVLIPEPGDPDLIKRVHLAGWEMVQRCVEMGGSLTGEHGVGIEKRQYMPIMHNPAELLAMWDVKQAFDPNGLLNPGKLFPVPEKGTDAPYAGYAPHHWQDVARDLPLPTGETFAPKDASEAAQGLVAFTRENQPLALGHVQFQTAHKRVSSENLRGIHKYAPDDLYITVGAGTPLTEIQSFLERENKQLAVASPWSDATIGGLVAANVNAPLRMRYGALRDQVLCATVALADGRVIRTGRPIVKNVAGYDLTKLFVGSYGTLGLLVDISLKISVRPRACQTVLLPVNDLAQGLQWSQQLLTLALNASALVLCQGYRAPDLLTSPYVLAYTIEGIPEDVQAELAQVRELLHTLNAPEPVILSQPTGTQIWSGLLADTCNQNPSLLVRAGIPVKDVASYILSHTTQLNAAPWIVDITSGQLYATHPANEPAHAWLETLRSSARAVNGYTLIMDAPNPLNPNGQFDRWGHTPESLPIMQRLKATWDPHNILNPNTFVLP